MEIQINSRNTQTTMQNVLNRQIRGQKAYCIILYLQKKDTRQRKEKYEKQNINITMFSQHVLMRINGMQWFKKGSF